MAPLVSPDSTCACRWLFFFFFNDTATTEIYTLSLHDALPISRPQQVSRDVVEPKALAQIVERSSRFHGVTSTVIGAAIRSEEHTSELQSRSDLVCRLLLEKKKRAHESPLPTKLGYKTPRSSGL